MDSIHGEKVRAKSEVDWGGNVESKLLSSALVLQVAESFVGYQRVQVLKVPLAGHQVFMDNVEAFNTMLTDALIS